MEKAIRYSRQREKIYEYLLMTKEHPSAEMIYSDLKQDLPELSLGTVYRNLKLLEELGKIRKITTHQGNERYDAVCGDHAHFICLACGAIADLPEIDADQVRSSLSLAEGYSISNFDLMLSGRCPKCS